MNKKPSEEELRLLWEAFCEGAWAAGGTSTIKAQKRFDSWLKKKGWA